MEDSKVYECPYVVVEGKQVLTANYVQEQMMYQSTRIDRAKAIARIAELLALAAIVISFLRG